MKYLCDKKKYQPSTSAQNTKMKAREREHKRLNARERDYEERVTKMSHDQINEPAVSSPKQTKSSAKLISIRRILTHPPI